MNLRGMANGLTQGVNPNQTITWLQSAGYTTDATGKQIAAYAPVQYVQAQVQALSGGDLKHAELMNMQGVMRTVYLYGNVQGIVRADQAGGDLLQFPEVPGGPARNWLVTQVVETWPDWAHVIVTLQAS